MDLDSFELFIPRLINVLLNFLHSLNFIDFVKNIYPIILFYYFNILFHPVIFCLFVDFIAFQIIFVLYFDNKSTISRER